MAFLHRGNDCVEVLQETRDDNQLVCTVARGSEVVGYVVVDSTVCGISRGGLRMSTNVSEAEVRSLARTMTLKCGFLRQPQGGAKAGVRFNPEAPLVERRQRLEAFGRAIAPLLINRIFIPGPDMGTDDTDIRAMLNAVGVKLKWRELRDTQSGQYAAVAVFSSAKRVIHHFGLTLSRCTVAIEDFGRVGSALAQPVGRRQSQRGGNLHPEGSECEPAWSECETAQPSRRPARQPLITHLYLPTVPLVIKTRQLKPNHGAAIRRHDEGITSRIIQTGYPIGHRDFGQRSRGRRNCGKTLTELCGNGWTKKGCLRRSLCLSSHCDSKAGFQVPC